MTKKPPQKIVVAVKRQSPVATDKLKIKSPWKALTPPIKAKLSETGWIGAIDALQLLTPHFGDEESAKAEIIQRLSQGSLTCRAACWCQEADRGKVDWHNIDWTGYKTSRPHNGQQERTVFEPTGDDKGPKSIPRDIFLASMGWTINADEASWKYGYFIARKPTELLTGPADLSEKNKLIRKFVYRLELHLSEVGQLILSFLKPKPADALKIHSTDEAKELGNTGNTRSNAWYDWVSEVVVYSDLHGIDTDMKAPTFHDEIAALLKARRKVSPKLGSTEKAFRAIKDRWREYKNPIN